MFLGKLLAVLLPFLALGLSACEAKKTQEGEVSLPKYKVEKTKEGSVTLPKYDVQPADVSATVKKKTVEVPEHVQVQTEKKPFRRLRFRSHLRINPTPPASSGNRCGRSADRPFAGRRIILLQPEHRQ